MPCWVGSFTLSVISGICCSVVCSDITCIMGRCTPIVSPCLCRALWRCSTLGDWEPFCCFPMADGAIFSSSRLLPSMGIQFIFCGTPYHLGCGESTQWMPAQECRDTLSVHLGCGESTQWMPAQECRDTLSVHLGCGESTHGMPAQECRDTLSVHLGCGESTQGMPAQECRDTPPGPCKAIFVTCNPGLRL